MSVSRYRTCEERSQAQQDHEVGRNLGLVLQKDMADLPKFVWGVIEQDTKVLGRLPPGPAEPHTFLHFLQKGDLSDKALAKFDPEALRTMQSLRQELDIKKRIDLSEWHAEWIQCERERNQWVAPFAAGGSESLLMQPAGIDLANHDMSAQRVVLDYWGDDNEMPTGTLEQRERWSKGTGATEPRKNSGSRTISLSEQGDDTVASA